MPKVKQEGEAEIARLREQLAQWRKANRPRARLPEEFWREAVGLARQAGLYTLIRSGFKGRSAVILAISPLSPHSTLGCTAHFPRGYSL